MGDGGVLGSVVEGLRRSSSPKQIPFSLLYDAAGTALFEQIVGLEEYYPFEAETALLKQNAQQIASAIPPHSLIVELGCGTATKSAHLLNALRGLHRRCQYAGIDVSPSALEQAHHNLLSLVPGLDSGDLHMVEGEYMAGLKQVREQFRDEVFCILWLGSSVGNLSKEEAILFMAEVLQTVGPKCQFFLCTDMWKDEDILYRAYHDKEGVTEKFIKNGMRNALSLLGHAVSQKEEDSWLYQVQVNRKLRRVEMWVSFPNGLHVEGHGIYLRPNEQVLVEFSRKFRVQDVQELAAKSNFCIQVVWRNKTYGCQMLCSQLQAILGCWEDTDALFRRIPNWEAKPIDLRHPFLFYYGHINSFTKLKLLPDADKSHFDILFSRGIDPSVLDPSKCHNHPEAPLQWPSCTSVSHYVRNVRSMVRKAIEEGLVSVRLVCMVLEHERMHQETLAYMVVQQTRIAFERDSSAGYHTPSRIVEALENEINPKVAANDNNSMLVKAMNNLQTCSKDCKAGDHSSSGIVEAVGKEVNSKLSNGTNKMPAGVMNGVQTNIENSYVTIPRGIAYMGCDPSDAVFAWDNEQPATEASVCETFWVSSKPVTIGQYMCFVQESGYEEEQHWDGEDFAHFKVKGYKWPATWSNVGGQYYVHTLWETKHWTEVAEDAVYVSLAEAEAYCKWVGSETRLMTEEQYERIITAGYDQDGKVESLRDGGWEWTSTVFKGFPGFKAMLEYPEYSVDFFDGKHFVLKGSSPATHPSLVRDSFRNFYQRQYRYMFAKFRCCMPVPAATSTLPDPSRPRAAENGSVGYRSAVFGHI